MSSIPQAIQEKKFSWLQEVSSTPRLLSRIQVQGWLDCIPIRLWCRAYSLIRAELLYYFIWYFP